MSMDQQFRKVWAIASGKGGVGKSTLVASLGLALAQSGSRVALVDMDLGLRCLDALLGLQDRVVYDLLDVIGETCTLEDALLTVPGADNLALLPASQFARAKEVDARELRRLLRALRVDRDFVLVDCPAGLERGLRNVIGTGICRAVVVTTPDDLCVRDAERLSGLLREKNTEDLSLIVNRLQPELIWAREMTSAASVSSLLDIPLLGEVPEDPMVYRAQLCSRPLVSVDCEARSAVLRIARRMKGAELPLPRYGSQKPSLFYRLFRKPLKEVVPLDDH